MTTLTTEEQLINSLGASIVQRKPEELKATAYELGKQYSTDELKGIWKKVSKELNDSDIQWMQETLNEGKSITPVVTTITVKPLTEEEKELKAELEGQIVQSLKDFSKLQLRVGEALSKIKSLELWREDHDSFEAYCNDEEKWPFDFGYKRAKQLSAASEVLRTISTDANLNERILRELGREKDPGKRQVILDQAIQQGTVTSTAIQKIRDEMRSPTSNSSSRTNNSKPQDVSLSIGQLVAVDEADPDFGGWWGKLEAFSPDGKRAQVRIAGELLVFELTELAPSRYVPQAIAKRVEALCQKTHPHLRALAGTYHQIQNFDEQWQEDLLNFLERT